MNTEMSKSLNHFKNIKPPKGFKTDFFFIVAIGVYSWGLGRPVMNGYPVYTSNTNVSIYLYDWGKNQVK